MTRFDKAGPKTFNRRYRGLSYSQHAACLKMKCCQFRLIADSLSPPAADQTLCLFRFSFGGGQKSHHRVRKAIRKVTVCTSGFLEFRTCLVYDYFEIIISMHKPVSNNLARLLVRQVACIIFGGESSLGHLIRQLLSGSVVSIGNMRVP